MTRAELREFEVALQMLEEYVCENVRNHMVRTKVLRKIDAQRRLTQVRALRCTRVGRRRSSVC